jgi:FkbH-like protein
MKKCIVLDLDNTLWGGIVGEDDAIQLSPSPPGNGFMAFQQALVDLWDRGVLLAINSRNNPEDAWEVIKHHPNMILRERHFAAWRINWEDKADNLTELAKELNIGLDAMVFLDDDPSNRGWVHAFLPEVEVPELPSDPTDYVSFLNGLSYFPTAVVTDEDKMRGNFFVTERLRQAEETRCKSREEFLASLNLVLTIKENDLSAIPRLVQMTAKTNQFNIHKRPLTEDMLRTFMEGSTERVFHGHLRDKFGDYGIVLLGIHNDSRLMAFLMSCRAFGRGIEDAFLWGISPTQRPPLQFNFIESARNAPAKEFIKRLDGNRPARPKWISLQ